MIGPQGNSKAAVHTLSAGTFVASITKGIQQLIGIRRRAKAGARRIVNKTGRAVVVRAKYKDVWEGEQWKLADGGEMLVPPNFLKIGEPYSRLGAFIGQDVSLKKSPPLYIGSQQFLASHEIRLILSPPPSTHLAMLSN